MKYYIKDFQKPLDDILYMINGHEDRIVQRSTEMAVASGIRISIVRQYLYNKFPSEELKQALDFIKDNYGDEVE